MKTEDSRSSQDLFQMLAVAVVVILAWLNQLRDYLPMADDFYFSEFFHQGLWAQIMKFYAATGIRRSFAVLSNAPLCAAPVEITNYLLISIHLAATLLLFSITKRLLNSPILAFLVTVLFGVFPFGYGAVTWACGSYIIPHMIFFLLCLLLLLRHADNPRWPDWVVAILAGILTFTSCILGEHLIFASTLTGLLAWTTKGEGIRTANCLKSWVLAPAIAVGIYLALAYLTQPVSGLMWARGEQLALSSINPRSLLSVWLYQWRHVDMFQPWLQAGNMHFLFADWSITRWSVFACLLAAFTLTFCKGFLSHSAITNGKPPSLLTIIVLLASMFGISAVHMLAGGYSATSRHQYVPLAFALVLGGMVLARILDGRVAKKRILCVVIGLVVFLGVLTTYLVTAISRFELLRYQALTDFIAREEISGPVTIVYAPPLYSYWPNMGRTTTVPLDATWVVNLAVEAKGGKPVNVIAEDAPARIRVRQNGPATEVSIPSGH